MNRASHSAELVASYYDRNTQSFYLDRWHPEDIHFGLFPAGCDTRDHRSAVKRMTETIVAPAGIRQGDSVVDAGCGVGGAALDVAREHGARVLGLTISPVQVALATARAEAAGLSPQCRFERADCSRALPCDDASVDVVVTIEAACHFGDKPDFLRECRRVLRKGGRLVGSDWMVADDSTRDDYARLIQPVCEAWRLAGLESVGRWSSLLAEAGFEVHDCVDFADEVLPNAASLARGRLDLMLENASGGQPNESTRLWMEQYETLLRAWVERCFTIGRFHALAP